MEAREILSQQLDEWIKLGAPDNPWQRYLVDNGIEFESRPLDPQLRERLMRPQFRRDNRRKNCFMNAQRLALHHREIDYYEGVVFLNGWTIPITHGWNAHNGAIIDMTYRTKMGSRNVHTLGDVPQNTAYLGVKIPEEDIYSTMYSHHLWMSILDDWVCRFPFINKTEHRDGVRGVA